MGIQGQVGDDRRHVEVELVIQRDDFSHCIRFAEVLYRCRFRNQQRRRLIEEAPVAVQEIEIKDFQEGRIRKADALVERVGTDTDEVLRHNRPGDSLDVGDVCFDRGADCRLDRVEFFDTHVQARRSGRADRVDALGVLVEQVVRALVVDDQSAEDVYRQADRKAGDVDCRKALVLTKVSQRDFDVIPEHWMPRSAGRLRRRACCR